MSNKLRKNLSVIMAVVMIFSVFMQIGVVASAEEASVLTFTVKDGKATISKADANATVIEIPAEYEGVPVVGVEQVAFLSCSKITEFIVDENSEYFSTDEYGVLYNKDKTKLVKFINGSDLTEFDIPESVVELGYYAFRMSKKLVRVYIPGSISAIGIDCFYDCNNLSDIIFSEGLTRIGELAFGFCTALTTINLPDSLKSVGLGAFAGCNLTGVLELPESLAKLSSKFTWSEVFSGPITAYSVSENNSNLSTDENGVLYNKEKTQLLSFPCASEVETFSVPLSVTSVARGAFNKATGLKAVECHDGITDFGVRAFGQTGLTSFVFPKGITEVPDEMFYVCKNLSEVVLPDGITSIGTQAFYACDALESVEFPDTVTEIAERAFYSSGISNIEIPDGVESIGTWMFGWCENLESVTIPSSVVGISDNAFYQCENLTDVYYTGTADEWDSLTVAEGNEYLLDATIHYNYGRTQGSLGDSLSWKFDKNTNTLRISGDGEMVSYESLGEYPWYAYRDEIEFVEIDDGVLSAGDNAFSGCLALKEVFLGDSVGKIGESTFADCASLSVVTVCAQTLNVQNTSFTEFNDRFVLLHNSSNLQAEEFAIANDINAIPFSYDNTKNVLEFSGEFTVYEDVDYNLLTQLIKRYSDTKYLFFEKLVFDGVTTEMIEIDDLGNVITDEEYLSFKNIYISISAVKGEGEEGITFARLIEMLENGNHEGFIIEIESEDGKERLDFEQVWNDFVDFVLKAASKLINWFSKLFKRK